MADLPKGGSFLFAPTDPAGVYTPEDFTDEHRMIYRTTLSFVDNEILPRMEELESQKEGLTRELIGAAGELGLLGADVPEEFGGTELDTISSTIIAECVGRGGSFCQAHGGQTCIGQLPIVFFGTRGQKERYLPDIVSGKKVSSYALTEPDAGTDAMSIKTRAVLSPDGRYYILNGSKQFITNAGFADLFIVFAKVDGDKFTAFIVDRDSEGLSLGPEEKKMGIKGSSTRSLIFEDMKVPVENLLYEVGRGHVVAFNILNIGRYKIAASAVGMAKLALELAANYANNRKQFRVPIVSFGLIREKLAEMAIRIYVAESMIYRTGGLLDNMLSSLDVSGDEGGQVAARGIAEYAVECSMCKVFATEAQAYAVDEGVQIHGGYGYIAEYPIERLYRDARIYRIFEGTNEINRVMIPVTILRRAAKGEFPLDARVEKLLEDVAGGNIPARGDEAGLVQAAKDVFLLALGIGYRKLGDGLQKYQEVLGRLADLAIQVYAMESAWLRAQKALAREGENRAGLKVKMAASYIYSTMDQLVQKAREVLVAVAGQGEAAGLVGKLAVLCRYIPPNTLAMRNEIATAVSDAGGYPMRP